VKKRFWALLLCALLTVGLAAPSASADEDVYFVAAGSSVLPLSDATMPFWDGSYLYVSSSIFTGIAWNALDVGHIPANAKQPLILYSGGDKSLMFTPGRAFGVDLAGNMYYPGAIERNGNVFVPVAVIAEYFGFEYSVIQDVSHGYLVWLRKPGFGLGDRDFANAAVYSMEERYGEYLKSKHSSGGPSGSGVSGPADPADRNEVYLCVEADTMTAAMLGVLDRAEAKAAFFCRPEFLEAEHDLLRRMTATGHTVGLLVDAAHEELTVAEQLAIGNEMLYRATCTKTRLCYVENGDQERVAEAESVGFRCLIPELDRSAQGLQKSTDAESLLQRITARREDTTVWLGSLTTGSGLQAFLNQSETAVRCLALTETS